MFFSKPERFQLRGQSLSGNLTSHLEEIKALYLETMFLNEMVLDELCPGLAYRASTYLFSR